MAALDREGVVSMGTASIYDIPVTYLNGVAGSLAEFRGKVLLVVNVASRCVFTSQYAALEALYQKYRDRGFVIVGFPCNQFLWQEPGDASNTESCSLKYGVSFPILAKGHVNGRHAHPLYKLLTNERRGTLGTRWLKWNFTKFLVDRAGNVVARYGPTTEPAKLEGRIEELLTEGDLGK